MRLTDATLDTMVGLTESWNGSVVADKIFLAKTTVFSILLVLRHGSLVDHFVEVDEDGRDIEAVRARHTVFTVVAGNGWVLLDDLGGLLKIDHLLLAQRFERAMGSEIILQVFHVGHTAERAHDIGERSEETECPRSGTLGRTTLLQMVDDIGWELDETSAQEWFHDDGWNVALLELVVLMLDSLVVPVGIVHLDLNEVPMIAALVVPGHHLVKHFEASVIGKSEIADTSCLLLFDEPVENAVIHISAIEVLHTTASNAMEQQIIDIIRLQVAERVVKHLLACLACLCLGSEVGELGGDEEGFAWSSRSLQGSTCSLLGETLAIGRARVVIVYAMVHGILDEMIDLLLIEIIAVGTGLALGNLRKAHHTITEERNTVSRVGIGAIGHFSNRLLACTDLLARDGFGHLGGVSSAGTAADGSSSTHYGSCYACTLQEFASVNSLLFHNVVRFLEFMLLFDTLDVDGCEWTRRAQMFACATTDTTVVVDSWNLHRSLVIRIDRNHRDGSRRTTAGTVAATDAVGHLDTIVLNKDGTAYLQARLTGHFLLVGLAQGQDGASRTDVATGMALGTAMTILEAHHRLHEGVEIRRWTEHLVGASRDTELATYALVAQIAEREGTWRTEWGLSHVRLLVREGDVTAIDGLLLGLEGDGCGHGDGCSQERTSGGTSLLLLGGSWGWFSLDRFDKTILQSILLAAVETVEAIDTTGSVDGTSLGVDGHSLALTLTEAASLTFIFIYLYAHEADTGEITQNRTYRTDRVAIETTAEPCHQTYDDERSPSYDETRSSMYPVLNGIEGITFMSLGPRSHLIVEPHRHRAKQIASNTAIRTIRSQSYDHDAHAQYQTDDKHDQNGQTCDLDPLRVHVVETSELANILRAKFTRDPREDVLHHAHWADDGTIDTSIQQGQDGQHNYDADIGCQYSWEELELCHPTQPGLYRACYVEEQ